MSYIKQLAVRTAKTSRLTAHIILCTFNCLEGCHLFDRFYWSTLISLNDIPPKKGITQRSYGSLKIMKDCEADNGTAIRVALPYFSEKLERCCVKAPSVP